MIEVDQSKALWAPFVRNDRFMVSTHGGVVLAVSHVNMVFVDKHNRCFFRYTENGEISIYYVHHAVLETFVGPRPEGLHALHRDDNSYNNRLDNLYWGTPKQNLEDRRRNNPGWSVPKPKLTADQVREIRARDEVSTNALATEYGVSHSTMRKVLRRHTWKHVE